MWKIPWHFFKASSSPFLLSTIIEATILASFSDAGVTSVRRRRDFSPSFHYSYHLFSFLISFWLHLNHPKLFPNHRDQGSPAIHWSMTRVWRRCPIILSRFLPLSTWLMLKLSPSQHPQFSRPKSTQIYAYNTTHSSDLICVRLTVSILLPPATTSLIWRFYPPLQNRRTISILCPTDVR